jgi:hypothetical protein
MVSFQKELEGVEMALCAETAIMKDMIEIEMEILSHIISFTFNSINCIPTIL